MTWSKQFWVSIAVCIVLANGTSTAQNFVRVTDAFNEAATDSGDVNYNGAAWLDFDNDGDEDLFVDRNRMYRNDGEGVFVEMNIGVFNIAGLGNGCSWADYDNDGDLDLYVASNPYSVLYRNDGAGELIPIEEGDINWHLDHRAFACAWGDYDSDGNIDLAVVHPALFMGAPVLTNMMYHNDGPPNYNFTRVTDNDVVMGQAAYTVGMFSDYDLDGDQDFFIGSGPVQNQGVDYLYRNELAETGTADLVRITDGIIAETPRDGQNFNWIDYDNDTDLDCYITNYQGGVLPGMANDLYRNDGEAGFTEITIGAIVIDAQVSLGNCWADFDNDGDLDCIVANESWTNKYYRNNGNGSFTSINNAVTIAGLFRTPVTADYDNDGDLDLFISGVARSQAFFRNDLSNANHYLKLKCIGVLSNRAAIGARVRILTSHDGNDVWQQREINSQNSFGGHNSYIVHFGLGAAEVVDSIEIYWPSGILMAWGGVSADQLLTIEEDTTLSHSGETPQPLPDNFVISAYPNPFNSTISITLDVPLQQEVKLALYDLLGREVAVIHRGRLNSTTLSYTTPASLASGIYFLRAASANQAAMQKIVLLK